MNPPENFGMVLYPWFAIGLSASAPDGQRLSSGKKYDAGAWRGRDSPVLGSLGSNPFVLLTYFVTSHFNLSGSRFIMC